METGLHAPTNQIEFFEPNPHGGMGHTKVDRQRFHEFGGAWGVVLHEAAAWSVKIGEAGVQVPQLHD